MQRLQQEAEPGAIAEPQEAMPVSAEVEADAIEEAPRVPEEQGMSPGRQAL